MFSTITVLKTLIDAPLTWAEPESTQRPVSNWGKLPLVSVTTALGVGLLSLACTLARLSSDWATPLFWAGMTILFAPVAVRFLAPDISRREGVGIVLVLSIGVYLASYLRNPDIFRSFDEMLHWRTAYDVLQTKHLFTPNSLLPVSPFHPGLECVTAAVASLSGLNIFVAGAIVLGTARLLMMLGLYLLFEQLSQSVRVAGLAVATYMGSSTFMFFDAQFSYESLGLPLAIMSVYMLVRCSMDEGIRHWEWHLLAALVLFTIVPTHHLTSYLLTVFMFFWAVVAVYTRHKGAPYFNPIWLAMWLAGVSLFWVTFVSDITVDYLAPMIYDELKSVYDLATGQSQVRTLFQNSVGQSAVWFERIVGIGSVLLLTSALPFGLWQWWLRYRNQAVPVAFALCAMTYPALPLMRLTGGAWEASNRLSGFVFIAAGFIIALGLAELPLPPPWSRVRRWLVGPSLTIIFLAGIVAGSSPQTRMPGPYLPAAGARSIDNQSIMAAEWARTVLGPNNHMAADRTYTTVMGAYGAQRMIANLEGDVSVSGLFLKYELTDSDRARIVQSQIHYLVVDRRITTVLPLLGYYFEEWEQMMVRYIPPVSIVVLEKFDHMPEVSRVFDSGDIIIYDVGVIAHAP